nr:hypothetical protein [Gammaproteobacteria bacterium]
LVSAPIDFPPDGVPTEIDFLNQEEHQQFWEGTLAQYNAITTYDADVHYIITDDTGASFVTAVTGGGGDGSVDINGIVSESAALSGDEFIFYDTSAAANRKITLSELQAITGWTSTSGATASQVQSISDNTDKVGISTEQAAAIVTNTEKVGITTDQSSEIAANTLKVGITTEQSAAIAGSVTLGTTQSITGAKTFINGFNVGDVEVSHSERLTGFLGDTALSNFVVSGSSITARTTSTTANGGPATLILSGTFESTYASSIVAVGAGGVATALSIGTTDVFAATGFANAIVLANSFIIITFDTQANNEAFQASLPEEGDLIITYDAVSEAIPTEVMGNIIELHTGTATSLGSIIGEHYTITSTTQIGPGASNIVTSVTVDRPIVVGSNTGAAYFNPPADTLQLDSELIVTDGVYLGGSSVSNLLDDYETGTWTPGLFGFVATDGTRAATSSTGTYVKVGNIVTLTGLFTFAATTSTSRIFITGLPFNSNGNPYGSFARLTDPSSSSFDTANLTGLLYKASSTVSILIASDGSVVLYDGAGTAPTTIRFTITHETT